MTFSTRFLRILVGVLTAIPAWTQTWDPSGNSQLTGNFYFRDVVFVSTPGGTITRAIMSTGTLNFTGNGTYSGSIIVLDSATGAFPQGPTSGTYTISASGYGFLSHPVNGRQLRGTVSGGVFLGSSTEGLTTDLMVMAPATPAATLSSFNGAYSLAYMSIIGDYRTTYNSMATLNPNGSGGVTGSVPVRTYVGGETSVRNNTETGVTYVFDSNGIGTLRFPTTAQLPLRGNKTFFITPDGNFIFGGALDDFDMFVGVRRHTGTAPAMDGLYYSAGLNHIPGSFDTFYGAFKAVNGTLYEHQRFVASNKSNPVDYTAAGKYPTTPTNDYTDDLTAAEYVVGRDANYRIGIGKQPYMTLRVAHRAPMFANIQSTDPFIDPTGVVNSASFAPFTAGVAHGEIVAIFGQNLSSGTQAAVGGQAFPKSMGGVQVKMNNRDCAIYFVSPSVITAVVPYGITESVIQIQVVRDGVGSNYVTAFRTATAPGIYTLPQSGMGLGAIRDVNFNAITESNPTQPGAVLQGYMTGLGDTFPVLDDGAVAPTNPLVRVVSENGVAVGVDNRNAEVQFAGLTPTLAALYQVNFKVPDTVSAGDVFVDILTADAQSSQAITRVSTTSADAPRKAEEDRPFVRRR